MFKALLGRVHPTTLTQVNAFLFRSTNCLSSLSGSRTSNADPLGKGDQFRHGLNLHFRHNPVAVGLYGAYGAAQFASNVLVGAAANDKVQDLPLTRCQ